MSLDRPYRFLCALIVLVSFALAPAARGALTIEIIGAGATQFPIAIVPFRAEDGLAQRLSPVVAADLERSGLFRLVDAGGVRPIPHEPEDLDYTQWSARGAGAVVIGAVARLPDGRYDVRFRLMDVARQSQLAGYVYYAREDNLRLVAHRIADMIYERITGDVGVFSTRITYVVKRGDHYELQVADADGYNPVTIFKSPEPIISPAWSPDGTRLAYVSFYEDRKPVVYVQSLVTGERQAVAKHRGSNSAPSWSPDGKQLVVTLTRDGSSEIYVINADGSGERRLTRSTAIDTEAHFSPDGRQLLFTSDRGGSPQIYRMPVTGGPAERLTFEGSYNVSARHSPDGRSFTFIRRNGSSFNVAVQDFASRQVQVLTDGGIDESPSFAPNGRMILYATEVGGRGVLSVVSSDGRSRHRLTLEAADVREPAWGPLLK